jgi:hypothetical protein
MKAPLTMPTKTWLRLWCAGLLALVLLAGAGSAADTSGNRIANGSFEETEVFPETHPYVKIMRDGGWTLDTPILDPKGWTPHPVLQQGEFKLLRDKAQAHSGETCVMLKGDLVWDELLEVKAGDRVTIQFWARAATPGQIAGVFYAYPQGRDALQQPEAVGTSWARYSCTFDIPAVLDGKPVTTVVPVLRSFTGALFDDVTVLVKQAGLEDLVTVQADQTRSSRYAFNGQFEDWQVLARLPAAWDLHAGVFPCRWLTEDRPDERGSLRRAAHDGVDRRRFGDYGLLLDGRLISEQILDGVFNKELRISVWARGAGGHLAVRVRLYGPPPAPVDHPTQLGRVIEADTGDDWQELTGTMLAYGNSVYGARLELIGIGVMLDNLRVTVAEKEKAETKEVFQPVMTIPVLRQGPTLAGGFDAAQWQGALEIHNGFMNMQTGNSVLRQTACCLASDGRMLFVCTTARVEGDLVATVQQRDGTVWADDSVEVYINPFYDRTKAPVRVYQFVVNANGAVYDHSVEVSIGQPPQPGWNCKGLEVKSERIGDDWVLLLAIPLSEVGIELDKPWGLNLCRTFQSPGENTSVTGGAYQDWKRMVACTISAAAPALAWGYTGNLRDGRLGASVTLANSAAAPQTYQVALAVSGQGLAERRQAQTVTVAPGGSQVVLVADDDQVLDQGQVTLQVADPQGRVWFDAALPIDRQEAVGILKKAAAAAAQPQRWRLEYYPAQGKVNIRLLQLANRRDLQVGKRFGTTHVCILKDDRVVLERTVAEPLVADNEGHLTFPFAPQEDGTYLVRATVADQDGDCMEFVAGTIEKQPMPWLGNSLGREPVIVPPFTPMRTHKLNVSCLGRDYDLGAAGLPAAITANGEPVLAGPITFVLEDDAGRHTARLRGAKLLERADDHVTFQGQAAFDRMELKLKGWAEYDGVIRYEVEMLPQGDVALKSLALELPVKDVTYLHAASGMRISTTLFAMTEPAAGEYRDPHVPLWAPGHVYRSTFDPFTLYLPAADGLVWSSLGITTPGVYGNFMPYIWIGNSRFGMCWFADGDRGWSHTPDTACLELVRQGAVTTLRVRCIAAPTARALPRRIVFGLLATPVKPHVVGGNNAIRVGISGFGLQFMERWSTTRLADYFLARNLKQTYNANGQSVLIYIANDLFNANDPAMASLKDEWCRSPRSADNHVGLLPMKAYGPDPSDYDSRAVCAVPSRVDYQIAGLDRCMREGALDGVYLDNSAPAPCTNLQHAGCGYIREDGHLQAGWHLFDTRDLIRRSAALSYQHKCHWPWWKIHSTSAMVAPCFTFADVCVDGEWGHDGKDFMDFFTLPYLEVFGAGASGLNPGWLPKLHGLEKEVKPTRTMLAACKLYDMYLYAHYCNVGVVQTFWDIEKAFGTTEKDCRFVGYWQPEAAAVAGLPVGVKSSYFVRPGKGALVYVSNFTTGPQNVTCRLDFARWDLGAFRVTDAESAQELSTAGGTLSLPVERHDFRLLLLEKQP